MNGGHYDNASLLAQQQANQTGERRYIHSYGGTWWISKSPVNDCEAVLPDLPNKEHKCELAKPKAS